MKKKTEKRNNIFVCFKKSIIYETINYLLITSNGEKFQIRDKVQNITTEHIK